MADKNRIDEVTGVETTGHVWTTTSKNSISRYPSGGCILGMQRSSGQSGIGSSILPGRRSRTTRTAILATVNALRSWNKWLPARPHNPNSATPSRKPS